MPENEEYYQHLLKLYLENRCNPAELEEVMLYLQANASNRGLLMQMQADFSHSAEMDGTISPEQAARIRGNLIQKISVAPVVSINRKKWPMSVAAAVAIGLVFLVSYRWFYSVQPAPAIETAKKAVKEDITPGGNKAVLTLADGSTIMLDDAQNGTLANQGNTKVIKLNGKLDYNASGFASKEILYNTIATPRGGQYQIELSDGSQVWLNAASSLHFPTAFAGKERRVEITGEAYFEVAKNKSMPFIVKVNNAEVQVLGTHFNVMAYNDESALKTTLLEGSVKFVINNKANMLVPGQQFQLTKDGQVKLINNVDVNKVVAWKNGLISFEGTDIKTIGRQLERWYDVEVIYNNNTDERFYAEIPRNTNLSGVLKALELTGKVHFKIEGRKCIVLP